MCREPDCEHLRIDLKNRWPRQVDQWHFRMLNDITRNLFYYSSITKAIEKYKYDRVLDIGAGAGLLRWVVKPFHFPS